VEPARPWRDLGARLLAEFEDDPDRYANCCPPRRSRCPFDTVVAGVGSSLTMRTVGGSEQQAQLLRAGDHLNAVGHYGLVGCSSRRSDASRFCRREACRPAAVMNWLTGADGRQHVADVVAGEGCAGERHAGARRISPAPQTASMLTDSECDPAVPCRMNHVCEER
jgi:hypothetical protein